jgi:hypothetical protein
MKAYATSVHGEDELVATILPTHIIPGRIGITGHYSCDCHDDWHRR